MARLSSHRVVRFGFALLIGLYIALGFAWTIVNLGAVPHYFDTIDYLTLAGSLTVDQYRGIVYPLFLAASNRLFGDPRLLTAFPVEPHPVWFIGVQLIQCGVSVLAFAYFLSVVVGVRPRDAGLRFGVLLSLLCFDPLISHFNLSVMTDSLALAASLTFCAALTDLALRRRRVWIPASLLFVACLVDMGLRTEKGLVLFVTALLVVALWTMSRAVEIPHLQRRAVMVLVLVAVSLGGITAVQRLTYHDYGRWPVSMRILHQRIIYPNLSSVYDDLSPQTRALLTREEAVLYDTHDPNTNIFAVIDRATHNDAGLRQRMTMDLTRTVLRRRWPVVARNMLRAAVENVLATPSFYGRWAAWELEGADMRAFTFGFDASAWTYFVLSWHYPRLSAVFVSLAALVILCAAVSASLYARRAVGHGEWRLDETLVRFAPAGILCLVNALAFAATSGLIHIRFVIVSHAVGVALVYAGALRWLSKSGAAVPS